MVRSVFKPSRLRDGKRVRSRLYWGQYRLSPGEPIRRVSLGTSDKRVAERRLDEIVCEIERERAGIVAPRLVREAAAKAVLDHLGDALKDMRSRGRSEGYVRKVDSRMRSLVQDCGWHTLQDISAESFLEWRGAAQHAPRTLNHYLDAAQVVLGWLVSTDRLLKNPLAGVQKVDTRGRVTIERRAFTDDELHRLRQVSGPRWPIYLTAVHTGLRLNELRSLCWGDVMLGDGMGVPRIKLRAETTKNRRADVVPLSVDVVEALTTLEAASKNQASRVFRSGMPSHHTFASDLERAEIPKVDELGRRVDFHALRKTYITNLFRAGVHGRVAMALARHSDGRLTEGVYTDEVALPLAEAVGRLPRLGAGADAQIHAQDAQIDAQKRDPGSPGLARNGTAAASAPAPQVPDKSVSNGASECPGGSPRSGRQEWSRGESNPRPETVSKTLLRV